jgi:hypothetical protein
VWDVLLISQHDAAARDTEKVHARLGHVSQRLSHAGSWFAEGGEPAQAGGEGLGINRHGLPAVRVDHGLSDVADLDMAVLGEAYQQ